LNRKTKVHVHLRAGKTWFTIVIIQVSTKSPKQNKYLLLTNITAKVIETTQVKLCDKVNIDYATAFFISLNHHIYELIKGL
jgi:hypothetical protein